ncbi:MAG: Gfo/Idh/MocA family protein [Pyrinomonadaceae bacterium]
MKGTRADRRSFIKGSLTVAAGAVLHNARGASAANVQERRAEPLKEPRLLFSVIGINHGHIHGQISAVTRGGGRLVSFYAKEPDLAADFAKRYPQARAARDEREILEETSLQLVLSAAIPEERAPLGVRVMRHGKDYMSDKPGITTLEQLAEVRRVQKETRRIYSIMYSERFESEATVRAGELVKAGAIGRVIQTVGLGPHRINNGRRDPWFYDRRRFGGIICDIGSHQADQFLFFTGSTKAEVVAAQVGNVQHPQYPNFEDFGDMLLRGDGGTGYVRVDWFTPDGLSTWGDGRLTILGTDGFIELRKNVDIAGRPGGDHLFLVDKKETRHIDCRGVHLPYGEQLVEDILNRTETAMSQEHCFLATELALKAQKQAQRINLRNVERS